MSCGVSPRGFGDHLPEVAFDARRKDISGDCMRITFAARVVAGSGLHLFRSARQPHFRGTRNGGLACKSSCCYLAVSERATAELSAFLADRRRTGDCLCLRGEVGAGKSAFSRAYIRHVEEDDSMPVPSPTYLLQNLYEYNEGPSIYHYDLYRLAGQDDLQRLDLSMSLMTAVNLIEWPDRLEGLTPATRLDVEIKILSSEIQAKATEEKLMPSLITPQAGCEVDSREDEEEEGADFADHRWRLITLQPHGHEWEEIVAAAKAHRMSKFGLHMLTKELSQRLGIDIVDTR